MNAVIAGNSPNGAQVFQSGSSFVNCTVTGSGGYGLAFLATGNTVVNSIVYGNSAGPIFVGFSGDVAVTYSDVAGSPIFGAGNIDAGPLFRNAGAGDYRLAANSPAIDAGDNAAVPAGATVDLSGLSRFFDDPAVVDTGAGSAPIVDMGAFERVPLSVSAPSSLGVCAPAPAGLSVTASGRGPLQYRWRKGGAPLADGGAISGATLPSLSISPTTPETPAPTTSSSPTPCRRASHPRLPSSRSPRSPPSPRSRF